MHPTCGVRFINYQCRMGGGIRASWRAPYYNLLLWWVPPAWNPRLLRWIARGDPYPSQMHEEAAVFQFSLEKAVFKNRGNKILTDGIMKLGPVLARIHLLTYLGHRCPGCRLAAHVFGAGNLGSVCANTHSKGLWLRGSRTVCWVRVLFAFQCLTP